MQDHRRSGYPAVQFRMARPTQKLEEVVRFYTEGLKLELLYSFAGHNGYDGVMIGLPGLEYHLEFTRDNKGTVGDAPGKDNLLVLYFDDDHSLAPIRSSLETLGYSCVAPENPYWENDYTFEDPDGWRVVLCNKLFMKQRLLRGGVSGS